MTVFPIVHEIVGQPGSLHFMGMEFDRISLILVAKKTFLGTLVALFLAQRSFKILAYDGDILDCIKKGNVDFDLLKDLQDLFYLSRLFLESI